MGCSMADALEKKGIKKERMERIQNNIRKGHSKEEIMDFMDCTEEEYQEAESGMFGEEERRWQNGN